ncbi:hypothetical protein KL86CLO1_11451 [uncultured Eubacteriales bacterium]|uniref:Uncharacterized protein n=1 Tax=uncultured Eubacteriales bacterium TaxID=172733 RepID=A0A212JPB2_9FIRM|nr:hypothetical protein KL86CLO1_11451 [uncultured Eubacteriales bacterium]
MSRKGYIRNPQSHKFMIDVKIFRNYVSFCVHWELYK